MRKFDDILSGAEELRQMPYSVPEGYFEGLEAKVRSRISDEEGSTRAVGRTRSFPKRLIPYLSAAAVAVVVAIGLTLGSLGRKTVVPESGLEDSDYVFYYTELIPVTEPEAIYYSYNSVSEDLSYDDIVEYLLESGADVDDLFNDLN